MAMVNHNAYLDPRARCRSNPAKWLSSRLCETLPFDSWVAYGTIQEVHAQNVGIQLAIASVLVLFFHEQHSKFSCRAVLEARYVRQRSRSMSFSLLQHDLHAWCHTTLFREALIRRSPPQCPCSLSEIYPDFWISKSPWAAAAAACSILEVAVPVISSSRLSGLGPATGARQVSRTKLGGFKVS